MERSAERTRKRKKVGESNGHAPVANYGVGAVCFMILLFDTSTFLVFYLFSNSMVIELSVNFVDLE